MPNISARMMLTQVVEERIGARSGHRVDLKDLVATIEIRRQQHPLRISEPEIADACEALDETRLPRVVLAAQGTAFCAGPSSATARKSDVLGGAIYRQRGNL